MVDTKKPHKKDLQIRLDGFQLHAKLYGENKGKPTIVMDAGYGDYSKAWENLVAELSKLTRVLVYDRAGLGKSEKSPNPRTSLQMVEELNDLLTIARVAPPYILVGHSFGGVNARIYATNYTDKVSGIVLVDSTPEDYRDTFLPTMSREFQDAYNKQFIYEGNYDEFMESLKQLKDTKRRLNIPVVVISAGKKAHYSKESQEFWNKLQEEILEISSKGELVIAENSAHYVQNDEPKVVIEALKRLIT